jgi:hypothetical protein
MVDIHDAIYALNPSVVTILGDIAYDKNQQIVQYDLAAAQTKLVELQAIEAQAEQAAKDAKASALAKLTALGLTQAEVTALVG